MAAPLEFAVCNLPPQKKHKNQSIRITNDTEFITPSTLVYWSFRQKILSESCLSVCCCFAGVMKEIGTVLQCLLCDSFFVVVVHTIEAGGGSVARRVAKGKGKGAKKGRGASKVGPGGDDDDDNNGGGDYVERFQGLFAGTAVPRVLTEQPHGEPPRLEMAACPTCEALYRGTGFKDAMRALADEGHTGELKALTPCVPLGARCCSSVEDGQNNAAAAPALPPPPALYCRIVGGAGAKPSPWKLFSGDGPSTLELDGHGGGRVRRRVLADHFKALSNSITIAVQRYADDDNERTARHREIVDAVFAALAAAKDPAPLTAAIIRARPVLAGTAWEDELAWLCEECVS
jgi:hypothetical protein